MVHPLLDATKPPDISVRPGRPYKVPSSYGDLADAVDTAEDLTHLRWGGMLVDQDTTATVGVEVDADREGVDVCDQTWSPVFGALKSFTTATCSFVESHAQAAQTPTPSWF